MTNYLKEQPQQIEEYDDLLVRRLIEKITIHEHPFYQFELLSRVMNEYTLC